MASSLAHHLGITDGTDVVLVNPPAGITDVLRPLPPGAQVRPAAVLFEQTTVPFTLLFAREPDVLRQQLSQVVETLPPDGTVWVAWPRPEAGIATSLTGEAVRRIGASAGLAPGDACDIGPSWTALRFAPSVSPHKDVPSNPPERASSH